jgi:hypothetical protein
MFFTSSHDWKSPFLSFRLNFEPTILKNSNRKAKQTLLRLMESSHRRVSLHYHLWILYFLLSLFYLYFCLFSWSVWKCKENRSCDTVGVIYWSKHHHHHRESSQKWKITKHPAITFMESFSNRFLDSNTIFYITLSRTNRRHS